MCADEAHVGETVAAADVAYLAAQCAGDGDTGTDGVAVAEGATRVDADVVVVIATVAPESITPDDVHRRFLKMKSHFILMKQN